MAVVILGGLVTSTVLNLFLMPALYLAFGHSRRPAEDETEARAGDGRRGDVRDRSLLRAGPPMSWLGTVASTSRQTCRMPSSVERSGKHHDRARQNAQHN